MLGRLILLFIIVPLADLILLMVMSQYTGWKVSVGLVIVSGIVGAYLARRSSLAVGSKIRDRLTSGGLSPDLLTDGAMILFAAGLLLTPGFITDAVGLSLLFPPCRRWYKARIANWIKRHVKVQVMTPVDPFGGMGGQHPTDPNTVEGHVIRESESDHESKKPEAP